MTEFSPSEIEELTDIVAGGRNLPFSLDGFGVFVDTKKLPSHATVDVSGAFRDFFRRYAEHMNGEGRIGELVDALLDFLRDDFEKRYESLCSLKEPKDDGRYWLYLGDIHDPLFSILEKKAMFAAFADEGRFVRTAWDKPSLLAARQIERSGRYFVVLADDKLDEFKDETQSILASVSKTWMNASQEKLENRKHLIVFAVGPKASEWWKAWKSANFPAGGSEVPNLLECKLATTADSLDSHYDALRKFLSPPPAQTNVPPVPGKIVVLGNPERGQAGVVSTARQAEEQLIAYLLRRKSDGVDYWRDGWGGGEQLDAAQRMSLLQLNPILVRAMNGDMAPDIQALLDLLVNRLKSDGTTESIREAVAKLRKVFWKTSSAGSNAQDYGSGLALSGTIEEIGIRLADLAGFPLASVVVNARFEHLDDNYPQRELFASKLKEIRKSAADDGQTVAFSLDTIEASVRLFDRSALNIVVAHDLTTRASDRTHVMQHFNDWEVRLDATIRSCFPNYQPKVLRVAALLKNFGEFDGLKLAEESTAWRWNILKLERQGEAFAFNGANIKHIETEARALLSQ